MGDKAGEEEEARDASAGITSARSLDYKLIIVMKTGAGVWLGRRREAVSSTTRNQSASQLQMGASQKRAPPSPRRDEAPSWDWEVPLQILEQLPGR